ncbi:MAG TPA: 3-hydroxyacyl-ACP dehydratase FabZ [Firmicutes bacterium]|nr:3-hydroxyacyl-ACP dehydratase FabZ [Candidatus Fermentithermobacillaceae bacterium]
MHLAPEEILPHRPPFLFISRIISIEPEKGAVAEYDVPHDLSILRGHFPGYPILPGVIVLEMLAQTGALAILSREEFKGKLAYLAGVDSARFRRPVSPGDTLRAEMTMDSMRLNVGRARGRVTVDGEEVARATILFAIQK